MSGLRGTLLSVLVLAGAVPAHAGLTFSSCIRDNDAALPGCSASAPGLGGAVGLALSPDGHQLYEAALDDFALGTFAIDGAGTLSFTRCAQGTSSRGGGPPECTGPPVPGLQYSQQVLVTPDGRFAYVGGPVLNVFARDSTTGALSYSGCVGASGSGCATTDEALKPGGAVHLALSPDGQNLYVTSTGFVGSPDPANFHNVVAALDRDAAAGTLTPAGCFSDPGAGLGCTETSAAALKGTLGVAVAPDGAGVYAANRDTDAISVFARAATGDHPLTVVGCIDETGGTCAAHGAGLRRPSALFVAPDGRTVTATTDQGTTAVLTRNTATQALSFSGCIKGAAGDDACAGGVGVGSAGEFYVTPDGRNAYTGGRNVNALTVYARDPATGFLTFVECIKDVTVAAGAFEAGCTKTAPAMQSAGEMLASPDGNRLYVAVQGVFSNVGALDTFARTPDTVATAPPALPASAPVSKTGVVELALRCPTGVTKFCSGSVTVNDGHARAAGLLPLAVRHVARPTDRGRVTVRLHLPRRAAVRARRRRGVSVPVVFDRINANGTVSVAHRRVRLRAART